MKNYSTLLKAKTVSQMVISYHVIVVFSATNVAEIGIRDLLQSRSICSVLVIHCLSCSYLPTILCSILKFISDGSRNSVICRQKEILEVASMYIPKNVYALESNMNFLKIRTKPSPRRSTKLK